MRGLVNVLRTRRIIPWCICLVCVGILIFLLIFFLGRTHDARLAKRLAVSYLNNRYHDDFSSFTVLDVDDYGEACVSAKSRFLNGEVVHVKFNINDFVSERLFYDDYLLLKYRDETVHYLDSLLKHEFSDYIIHYDPTNVFVWSAVPENASFARVFYEGDFEFSFIVEVRDSDILCEEKLNKFFGYLNSLGVDNDIYFVSMDDSLYGHMSENELRYDIATGSYLHCFHNVKVRNNLLSHYLRSR